MNLSGRVMLWLVALSLTAGCTPQLITGGEDSAYLKDLAAPKQSTSQKLLPLAPGNYWEMKSASETSVARDKILVVGPKVIGPNTGMMIHVLRDGVLWRQEVYRNDENGLALLAFGEKRPDLLVISPPLPLLKPSLEEGNEIQWKGSVTFKGKTYAATAFTRVTGQENLQTRMGRFLCYRIDSVITLTRRGELPLHFPSIRWFSEKIGFVRRSFADAGKPGVQDLERYQVQGN